MQYIVVPCCYIFRYAIFHMLENDSSAVPQGGSGTVSGSSDMGGPPGSGSRDFWTWDSFSFQSLSKKRVKSISSDWTSLTSYPVLNVITAENKLLLTMLLLKRPEILTVLKTGVFAIVSLRLRVHLKAYFILFLSWMSCILPLKLHTTTVLNKVLLAVLEPLTSISLHKSPHQKNNYITLKVKDNNCRASVLKKWTHTFFHNL